MVADACTYNPISVASPTAPLACRVADLDLARGWQASIAPKQTMPEKTDAARDVMRGMCIASCMQTCLGSLRAVTRSPF